MKQVTGMQLLGNYIVVEEGPGTYKAYVEMGWLADTLSLDRQDTNPEMIAAVTLLDKLNVSARTTYQKLVEGS